MFRGTALITNPGDKSRTGEIEGLEEFLIKKLGCPIQRIKEPATLDGGDVLKVDNTIYVGLTKRTNQEGIK